MVGRIKLNLVLRDHMNNEKIMVVVQLEQLQGTPREARKYGPPPNHIHGILVRYKDVFTNVYLKNLLRRNGMQLCWTRYKLLELCGDKWSWWTDMRMVKAIQKEKWPLTQKGFRSLVGLANYYYRFIWDFSKVARTLFNLLKNGYTKSRMNIVTNPLRD